MYRFTLSLIAIICGIGACGQQPATGQAHLLEDFVRVYNTGDTTKMQALLVQYHAEAPVVQENVRRSNNEFQMIGGIVARKTDFTEKEITAWVQGDNSDTWWKLIIQTDGSGRFTHHHMQYNGFTSDLVQSGVLTQKAIADSIRQFITAKLITRGFSGNVLVARDANVLFEQSFGNDAEGNPLTSRQDFNLASMGKLFTTVAILQLQDQQRLHIDDSVGKFLPQLKNEEVKSVTLRQLLTHTSGMGDFFEDPIYNDLKDKLQKPADFMPFFEKEKLRFEKGTGFFYSNTGFELLALVIEKITGTAFTDYVQTNIFQKAGMQHSTPGGGAGGGRSTTTDLLDFAMALQHQTLLLPATNHNLLTYTDASGKWGLGTMHHVLAQENIVGHSGGFENVCTELNLYTQQGYVVIILSNSNPPYGHFLAEKMKSWLVRKDAPTAKP